MSLHKALRDGLEKLPNAALERVLNDKLKEAGVRAHKATAKRFAEHLMSGSEEPFEWGAGEADRLIDISFTDDDFEKIDSETKKILAAIPEAVANISRRVAEDLAQRYALDWKINRYLEERATRGFRDRLEDRWGTGLDGLRVLLATSMHLGRLSFGRLSVSRARTGRIKNSVLCQLHIRACQASSEVLVLLENGFADGALARWRTLHEISIVSLIVSDNDDSVAQRYVDHEAVEAKKALDRYQRDFATLGERPISKRNVEKIERAYAKVVSKYGPDFKTEHGWASSLLGITRPRFIDLQDAAGRGSMHSHYKNASYNVHAGSRALTLRVSNIYHDQIMIAGASNGGIDDVGVRLAESISLITSTLPGGKFKIDNAVSLLTIASLRDKAISALVDSGTQLLRDDIEIKRASAEHNSDTYVQGID